MKILTCNSGHEYSLLDEVLTSGGIAFIPEVKYRTRVNRKSNKQIEKTYLLIKRIVFADVPDPRRFMYCTGAWSINNDWREVPYSQVIDFINALKRPTYVPPNRTKYSKGQVITLPFGPFAGLPFTVTNDTGTHIAGHLPNGMNLTLEWLTNSESMW